MTRPHRVFSILLLPVAAMQAWFYEITGRPYLPVVYNNPGPESQQLLPEPEDVTPRG